MDDAKASRGDVFIVDDDPAARQILRLAFSNAGYGVACFADGSALLAAARLTCPYCILLDVDMPEQSGLDILRQLRKVDYPAPVFMISGTDDIAVAIEALKEGALDFIRKPLHGTEALLRVETAVASFAARRIARAEAGLASPYLPGRQPLTLRERDVLNLIARGISNKEVSRQLGISPRTVEDHRLNIMKKLGAKNAIDLMRIVLGPATDTSKRAP